ncbi:MAG TPA: hypothetical protein VI698_02315 [Nitrososphaerales archaeon]|nr:hypothetical protein [Nitrososphaerales archaeon]
MNKIQSNVPKKKVLLAGIMMLSLLVAAFIIPASAQESSEDDDRTRDKVREKVRDQVREHRPDRAGNMTALLGIGAAVDTDENTMYRSHLRFGIAKVSDTETDYVVKRGLITINDEGSPVRYQAIPETWTIDVRDDKSAFAAEGAVKDSEDNEFRVSLNGELLQETKNAWLFIVKGDFHGDDLEYNLYYLAVVLKRPAVQDIPIAARE